MVIRFDVLTAAIMKNDIRGVSIV